MARVSITRKIHVREPGALPGWAAALPLHQWYGIPDTALSSVAPSPADSRYGSAAYKIGAWNGATLKRSGSVYMLGAAGGHGDYAGNEVNAITLNSEAPAWVELRPRSAIEDVIKDASVYLDGRRAAIHTYCSTQFDQVNNRMLIVSGGGIHGVWSSLVTATPGDWPWLSSGSAKPMMAFGLSANDWLAPDALSLLPANIGGTDAICCARPDGAEIYAAGAGWTTIRKYTVSTDTWSDVGPSGYAAGHGSAMDPDRNQILIVGANTGVATPRLFDITTGANLSISWGGLGAAAIQGGGYPGVVYDEANQRYIVAKNVAGFIELFTVDPDTYEIAALPVTGTKPAARPNGIHNSLQYVPELFGIVIANDYYGDLKFMRVA